MAPLSEGKGVVTAAQISSKGSALGHLRKSETVPGVSAPGGHAL